MEPRHVPTGAKGTGTGGTHMPKGWRGPCRYCGVMLRPQGTPQNRDKSTRIHKARGLCAPDYRLWAEGNISVPEADADAAGVVLKEPLAWRTDLNEEETAALATLRRVLDSEEQVLEAAEVLGWYTPGGRRQLLMTQWAQGVV